MLSRLQEIVEDFCLEQGCEMIEFNGEADHVHLLFGYYPQLTLSKFVNSLKTVTSRLVRKEFSEELKKFTGSLSFGTVPILLLAAVE